MDSILCFAARFSVILLEQGTVSHVAENWYLVCHSLFNLFEDFIFLEVQRADYLLVMVPGWINGISTGHWPRHGEVVLGEETKLEDTLPEGLQVVAGSSEQQGKGGGREQISVM